MRSMPDSAAPGAAVVDKRRRGRPPWHRWRTWLTPAAAAVAIAVAVAVTLMAVRNAPAGRSAALPPAASANGVPEYYVALPPVSSLGFFSSAPDAVVGDTLAGKRIATVPAPAGLGFGGVTAADDDRTFALAVQPRSSSPQSVPTRWYLLRRTPGAARSATLRQLPIPAQPVLGDTFSMALSPDGAMLAIATETEPPVTMLRVYSTASGALLHTWSAPPRESHGIETLSLVSWASEGRQLTFQASASTNGPVAVRLLPADDPGHDLLADSRPVVTFMTSLSSPHNCIDSFVVAGNGQTVVCGSSAQAPGPASYTGKRACVAGTRLYNTAVLQFSAVTGKLAGTLYQLGTSCQMPGDLALFWANDAGTAVLGYSGYSPEGESTVQTVGQFGLFTKGKFTPLPAPLESFQGYPSITAW
jgi:hypothetical protein